MIIIYTHEPFFKRSCPVLSPGKSLFMTALLDLVLWLSLGSSLYAGWHAMGTGGGSNYTTKYSSVNYLAIFTCLMS